MRARHVLGDQPADAAQRLPRDPRPARPRLRTSASVIAPFGPVPVTVARSTPSSWAILRTSGVARTRAGCRLGTAPARRSVTGAGSRLARPRRSRPARSPTGTTSPSATRIRATLPAAGDGISTVVLSVWISTSGSSSAISSPSATSQRAISPSVRPSPRSGSLNSYASQNSSAAAARRRRRARPTACTRPRSASTDTARRSRSRGAPARAGRGSPSRRSTAASSAPNPATRGASCTITTRPVFATEASSVSSSSGFSVRTSSTSTDAVERVGRLLGDRDHRAVGDERQVAALARDAHLPERDDVLALGHLAAQRPVDELRLEDRRPGRDRGSPRRAGPSRRPAWTGSRPSSPACARSTPRASRRAARARARRRRTASGS